ncbi:MAG TPA: hypothetical protein VIY51_19575 [Xanthobacteraceae bacterium]
MGDAHDLDAKLLEIAIRGRLDQCDDARKLRALSNQGGEQRTRTRLLGRNHDRASAEQHFAEIIHRG